VLAENGFGSLAARELPVSAAANVLVVSDDPRARERLGAPLADEGYCVFFASSAGASIGPDLDVAVVDLSCASGEPDVIIGVLRARTDVPIMAVATVTVEEATVLCAYRAGADQCVNGVARPRELVARVRALLRRNPPRIGADAAAAALGGLTLDASRCTAIVTGVEIALTAPEREILEALIRQPGRVVRREELVGSGLRASVLDSYVRRLRDKLEAVDGRRRIVVVRGVGFRFDVD
jgi:DNA-binding response OmpR family regulator